MNEKYPPKRIAGLTGPKLKGKTFEEFFGSEKAKAIKEKMRLAKLGKKMPWNSIPERVGEKHPRWIKDRSKVIGRHNRPFHDSSYKQWRKSVLERDEWKCKIADENCRGKIICHHILTWQENPDARYDINNGIALCHFHHPRTREEEKRLAPKLQALLVRS